MAAVKPAGRTTPLWRRPYVIVLTALLLLIAGYVFVLPQLLRGRVERALSAALKTPVTIGSLSWRTTSGEISAGDVRIGPGKDALFASRVRITSEIGRLLRRELVIQRINIDDLQGTVLVDPQYRLALAGLETGGGTGQAPDIDVDEILVSSGKMTLRYPLRDGTRDVEIDLTRLLASDLHSSAPGGLRMQAEIAGTVGGAKMQGDLKIDAAADPRLELHLDIAGAQVNQQRFDLPAALQGLDGKVSARLAYQVGKAAPQGSATLGLEIAPLQLTGAAETQIKARKLSLPQVQIDFGKQRVDLGALTIDNPEIAVRLTDAGLVTPFSLGNGNAPSKWSIRSERIDAKTATLAVRREQGALGFQLKGVRWDGFVPGQSSAFTATASPDSGGSIAVKGKVGIDPLVMDLNAELEEVTVAPVVKLLGAAPLGIARGNADGVLTLQYRNAAMHTAGKLRLNDIATAPPSRDQAKQVMAAHVAEVDFSLEPAGKPWLDIHSLRLDYPYLMIERYAGGVYPYDIARRDGGADSASATGAIRLRQIEVAGGKIEFMDTTLAPQFWTSLTSLQLSAADTILPELRIASFELSGKQDELSPALLTGALTEAGLKANAHIDSMLLPSMNPYVSALLGYRATAGLLTLDSTAMPAPPLLKTDTEMKLRGIDVQQTGEDIIQRESGVPLPVALNLLKNLAGEISLSLPVSVDTNSRAVTFGSMFGDAIRSAILGAITAPLRLLGNLFGRNQAPHAFAIDPVPFAPGSGSLDAAGKQRVEEIAQIIRAHPGLEVVMMPQISATDLAKTGNGEGLAEKRGKTVRDALLASQGDPIAEKRLMPVKWDATMADKATGRPSVYIELQAH